MLNRLSGNIDIEIRPVKMVFIQKLDILDRGDGRVLEPGKVFERKKALLRVKQQPYPVLRDLRDFNFQSVCAKRL